jgi:hypothetical protein
VRVNVLKHRIVKIVALLMVTVPRFALSDANLVYFSSLADTNIRELVDEVDPDDNGDCLSLGALEIVFRTDNDGPPNVGVVLTDPRGRRFGFNPLTERAWDALPVAQGYIDCDDPDGAGSCRGLVQVCGPISGTYRIEVIARQTTNYSLRIFARTKEVFDGDGLQSSYSEDTLNNVAIRARSRSIVLLNYSRDPQQSVSAQLQHVGHTHPLESRSHRHPYPKSREHSVAGQE